MKNLILSMRLTLSWKKSLFLIIILHIVLLLLTFVHSPMFGEYSVRGTLNREPNIVHWDIIEKVHEKAPGGKLVAIKNCPQCFFPNSFWSNPSYKNGFHVSNVQPLVFFSWNNIKYPIMFSDRIGAIPYMITKVIKEHTSMRFAINFMHFLAGCLVIVFMGIVVQKKYGDFVSIFSMFLMSTSVNHLVDNGNFITKKFETVFLWLFIAGLYFKNKWASRIAFLTTFLSITFVKSTQIFNFLPTFAFISRAQLRQHFKDLKLTGILAGVLGLCVLIPISRYVYLGYVEGSEYIKEFGYFKIAIYDSILMIISPLKYLEFFLGIDNWFFPGSTHSPTSEELQVLDIELRLKGLGFSNYFLGLFFITPVFFQKIFNFKKKYLPLYSVYFLYHIILFYIAVHRFFTSSLYTWGILGIIMIVYALIIKDLLDFAQNRFKKFISFCLILIFLGIHFTQLVQFVSLYRNKGPITTFSVDIYEEMAKDLESRNIYAPFMFFMAEFGNIDNFSDTVRPIYIHSKIFKNAGQIFNYAPEGHILFPLFIDWFENITPQYFTKELVEKYATQNGVEIETIRTFTYRDTPTYWLFRYKHKDFSKFYEKDFYLSKEEAEEIFLNNNIFR